MQASTPPPCQRFKKQEANNLGRITCVILLLLLGIVHTVGKLCASVSETPMYLSNTLAYDMTRNRASQVARVVKNLPASEGDIEIQVQSLGQEDPLEESMATHSSILAWRIP